MSAKIGVFGKSFYDIFNIRNQRLIKINDLVDFEGYDPADAKKKVGSLWSNLFPKKADIQSQMVDIPDLFDTTKATEYLNTIKQIDAGTHNRFKNFQEYHDELSDGEKYIAKYAQETQGQIRTTEGLVQANQNARQAAIAHNNALKQQTLGAKAASMAMKALSVAGNILLSIAIQKAIEWTIKGLDALVTTTKEHQEQLQNLQEEYDEAKQNLEDVNSQIVEYENRIKELQGKTLTPVEEEELQRIQNLNEQLKIEKEVLEEIERIKKGETSDKAIETINSKKGGMTRMEMIEDYAHSGYVNTQKEIDRIMSDDYMTSEEKNYEIKHLREHQDSLRQQALEITSELLEEAKALDQNDAEAKELYDKIQALSAETLTWAKDVDTATSSVNENSNATSNASENANEMTDSLDSLSSAIKAAESAFELFNEVEKDYNSTGAISAENIQKILNKFPELEDELYEYIMGMRTVASVMDLLKAKSDDMATMSTKAFKKMYLSSNSASKNIVADHKNAFDYVAKGWDATKSVMANVNSQIIDANGNVCTTFTKQWETACEAVGTNMQALASGFASFMLGEGYSDGKGVYRKDVSTNPDYKEGFYSKTYYDTSGAGTNLTEAKTIELYGKNYTEAQYQSVFEAQKKQRADILANNAEIERRQKEFEERMKQYAVTSDDKSSGSDKNEALDNYLKDAENRYKVHQDETKYIQELQYAHDNLTKSDKERLDITGKINEAYRDLADNRVKDLEHQNTLLEKSGLKDTAQYVENLKAIQKVREEEANRLRALGYDDSSNEIQSLQSGWWDDHAKIVEADFANSEEYINERNRLGDWHLFNDSEVKAWERVLERFTTEYPNEIEKIKEIEEKLYDARKDEFNKSIEDMESFIDARDHYNDWESWGREKTDAIKDIIAEIKRAYRDGIISLEEYNEKIADVERDFYNTVKEDFLEELNQHASQISSLEKLLQTYYDITNSIAEAQHEINKELATSKTMYQWLDKESQILLFNQKDYNILHEELSEIQEEADRLQRRYNRDIRRATAENLEEITSQYEMQYKMLMKSYEIAKADLEVAKKKQQLNNVLNERNVRMFINGQWQWVANTQDVQNAQSELADTKYAKQKAELSKEQEESINVLISAQDKLATTINNVENGIANFDEQVLSITGGLSAISNVDVPALKTILNESCSAIKSFAEELSKTKIDTPISYSKTFDYSAAMASLDKNSSAWKYLNAQRNAKIAGEKLNYKPFATGTRYTPSGNLLLGEERPETFISNNGHLIPINQPMLGDFGAGGIVFNQEQMANLRSLWDLSNINRYSHYGVINREVSRNVVETHDNRIIINDITVGDAGNEDWINGFRRFVATHKH